MPRMPPATHAPHHACPPAMHTLCHTHPLPCTPPPCMPPTTHTPWHAHPLTHMPPGTHAPWHTPCPNFVAGGNNIRRPIRFIAAQKRSCGKVMFSQVSVILFGGCPHVTITHNALGDGSPSHTYQTWNPPFLILTSGGRHWRHETYSPHY